MIPDNDWYGHKYILSLYCELAEPRPIFGSLRHGWHHDWTEELGKRRVKHAPIFVWNRRHLSQAKRCGTRNVYCIGAPFIYLVELLQKDGTLPRGKGTLSFPAHTAEGESPTYSAEAFVAEISARYPSPYTVSVFYQDLNHPYTQVYRDAGWRIVTFGTRSDRLFLVRQALEILAHSHAVSNHLHTAIWYAAILERQCSVLTSKHLGSATYHSSDDYSDFERRWPAMYARDASVQETKLLAQAELGYANLQSPAQLRSLLGWSGIIRPLQASIIGKLIDVRYGCAVRQGW